MASAPIACHHATPALAHPRATSQAPAFELCCPCLRVDRHDPPLDLLRCAGAIAHPHLLLAIDRKTPEALPRQSCSRFVIRLVTDHDDLVLTGVEHHLDLTARPQPRWLRHPPDRGEPGTVGHPEERLHTALRSAIDIAERFAKCRLL